ncbi:MAG: MBOAT family protein [Clostridia bacterium]|nr:MBOAT family protein [Clostridia bacterium]
MNFNSLQYILFLPVTVILYYVLPKKIRNPVLLIASYVFYISWGPAHAVFIILSTLTTFFAGILIEKSGGAKKKLLLIMTLIVNLGILFVFKYYNFFAVTVGDLLGLAGSGAKIPTLNLLQPAGISFYTFMAAGYIIDVYRGKSGTKPNVRENYRAERNIIDYALFVSFFPQIISGPIERAGNVLPQLKAGRSFDIEKFKQGLTLIIWGMVKKMIIADNLAVIVNKAYGDPRAFTGMQLAFATLCFTFQIYCDFAGCTDIARGSAKLVGIDLMENFKCPYTAGSIKDFWRRWHISLSSWFRDYLYFPLGGSRVSKARQCFNVMVVFLVSGLWHGAAVTYIVWGFLHGLYQIIGILLAPLKEKTVYRVFGKDSVILKPFRIAFTFILVSFAWILFKANSISDAVYIIRSIIRIPSGSIFPLAFADMGLGRRPLAAVGLFIVILAIVDIIAQKKPLLKSISEKFWIRWIIYLILVLAIFFFGYYGSGFEPQDFIYFKY